MAGRFFCIPNALFQGPGMPRQISFGALPYCRIISGTDTFPACSGMRSPMVWSAGPAGILFRVPSPVAEMPGKET